MAHTVTANGNAQIDTAQSKFGGASGLFDGTGDYLSIPDHADWDFGSGAFTVECWVRFNNIPTNDQAPLIGQEAAGSRAWALYLNVDASDDQQIRFLYTTDGSSVLSFNTGAFGSVTLATGTWYHIAVTRDGQDGKIFLNGTQTGATHNFSSATLHNSTAALEIGRSVPGSGNTLNGWLDELRVIKGTAVYTANFTAPSAELDSCTYTPDLLLHMNGADASTTFTDSSDDACPSAAGTPLQMLLGVGS